MCHKLEFKFKFKCYTINMSHTKQLECTVKMFLQGCIGGSVLGLNDRNQRV